MVLRKFLTRVPLGSFQTRLAAGGFERPWYAWCLYYAALEAKALNYKAITALELGVAGGNGLVCLCDYASQVERETGIHIFVQGLDAGSGLPETSDPRDVLYCWPAGSFQMDYPKLLSRLNGRAEVLIGDVAKTAKELAIRPEAPLGAIMFDLDFYSSTRDAFALFSHDNLLPRVWCYFDDVCGYAENAYSDRIGVREAIRRFNANSKSCDHISRAYVFKDSYPEAWHQQISVFHRMSHPDYNKCLSDHRHTLDLR
jgi:hypothetical protein